MLVLGKFACLVAQLVCVYGSDPGTNSSKTSSRIIEGKEAVPHSYPSLIHCEPKHGMDHVLAVLLHPAWVLTAAGNAEVLVGIDFYAGRHDLANSTEAVGSQRSYGEDHIHPGYVGDKFRDDIALYQLRNPFKLNDEVQIVPVATDAFILPEKARMVGWGGVNLSHMEYYSDVLLEAETPIVPNQICKELWRAENVNKTDIVYESSICSGEPNGSNACFGELGGPLYAQVEASGKPQQVLLGVLSHPGCWGRNTKTEIRFTVSSVYARVSKYIEWIQNVTGLQYEPEGNTGYGYFKGSSGIAGRENGVPSQDKTKAAFKVASGLAQSVCTQIDSYSTNKNLSPPVKKRPAGSLTFPGCGSFQMQKCETSSCQPFQYLKC